MCSVFYETTGPNCGVSKWKSMDVLLSWRHKNSQLPSLHPGWCWIEDVAKVLLPSGKVAFPPWHTDIYMHVNRPLMTTRPVLKPTALSSITFGSKIFYYDSSTGHVEREISASRNTGYNYFVRCPNWHRNYGSYPSPCAEHTLSPLEINEPRLRNGRCSLPRPALFCQLRSPGKAPCQEMAASTLGLDDTTPSPHTPRLAPRLLASRSLSGSQSVLVNPSYVAVLTQLNND